MTEAIVTIKWTAEDVKTLRPKWSDEKCADWLHDNRKVIEDRSIEMGWEVMKDAMEWHGD